MPDLKLRRRLLIVGLIGLLFTCAGLQQFVAARTLSDWSGARLLLVVAWLILTPLFLYVMTLRRGARRRARRTAEERLQVLDAAAEQLRTPEGIRALGGSDPSTPPASVDAE